MIIRYFTKSLFKKFVVPQSNSVRHGSSASNELLTEEGSIYKFRPLMREDIPQVIELRRENNLYDGVSACEIIQKIDSGAIVVSTNDEGKIAAFGSVKNNTEDLCTAGFRTIHKDYRRLGLSKHMLNAQADRLTQKNVLGNSEAQYIQWHANLFKIIETDFICLEHEYLQPINTDALANNIHPHVHLQKYEEEYLPQILEYDQSIIGYRRELEVAMNCQDIYGITYAAFNGSKCVGYGTLKLNIQGGRKLGPLYADEPQIAEALLKKLLQSFVIGKGFATTTLSNNIPAITLFSRLNRANVINNYRFYTKERFIVDTSKVYALFEMEFEPF